MTLATGDTPPLEELDDAVRSAPLLPLLAALAQTTGDLSLLRADLTPDPALMHDPQGGLSAAQRAAGRELAVETLRKVLGGGDITPVVDHDSLRRIMAFVLGQEVSDDYLPLLIEELAVSGSDLRAPDWRKDDIDADRDFVVVIIGAGMSGLVAAHRMHQAGVRYIVLEKNDEVGGTWLENAYPGCRVDVPNHLYSYSFVQRHDWPHRFSPQGELLDYFRSCADDLGLREHIRFGAEVVRAEYDEADATWSVTIKGGERIRANVLVSAVGQLNRPNFPAIAGRDTFAGPSFHSAQWDARTPLAGKRVAVIGTGASGFQLIPTIADDVDELLVFQRTPNWFMPTPDYHDSMPDGMQWLLGHVPFYSEWYRFWLFWRLAEGALPAARVDPEWSAEGGSVSALNDMLREMLTQYLQAEFADAPDLLDHVVPRYPPLAKRMLLDNGTWARALKRDNVHLITEAIERITPSSIITRDGVEHSVDVIVYATGFEASRFLTPMRVIGEQGADLHDHWDGDARAYLGITVPGFPNLFCMYGPNTNLVANGSIIFFSECEASYITGAVRLLLEEHARAVNCRRDIYDAYNERVETGNRQMAWGASTVNSWYKNASGRVTQNWPFTLLEFWQRTRQPDRDDYELL